MDVIKRTLDQYPHLKAVLTNIRHEKDANHHEWTALAYIDGQFYQGPRKEITVVDRIGCGDATTAYFMYGMLMGYEPQKVIDLATAAGALKAAYIGDTLPLKADAVEREAQALRKGSAVAVLR